MGIERRALKGGRLRSGAYDEGGQRLELEFVDGSVTIYKSVPAEVWRRLLAAPNPASYHEDRIAEEYPVERGSAAPDPHAKTRLDALFGSPPAKD
ncbi:MAG TPA: KTSC domain-containing protein [Quisquiliibacterium sp.]|nr:KTSC domain-containing protein [Quisquiliibacterium sp.]